MPNPKPWEVPNPRASACAACPGVGPIVQVCTSTTFPVHALLLHTTCCEYLNAHPPKALGKHACSTYRVDFVKSNAAFRARCLAHSIRVGSMCAMLRLAKEAKVAKKVRAWKPWCTGTSSAVLGIFATKKLCAPRCMPALWCRGTIRTFNPPFRSVVYIAYFALIWRQGWAVPAGA